MEKVDSTQRKNCWRYGNDKLGHGQCKHYDDLFFFNIKVIKEINTLQIFLCYNYPTDNLTLTDEYIDECGKKVTKIFDDNFESIEDFFKKLFSQNKKIGEFFKWKQINKWKYVNNGFAIIYEKNDIQEWAGKRNKSSLHEENDSEFTFYFSGVSKRKIMRVGVVYYPSIDTSTKSNDEMTEIIIDVGNIIDENIENLKLFFEQFKI